MQADAVVIETARVQILLNSLVMLSAYYFF